MKTLQEEWNGYLQACYPDPRMPADQARQLTQAFFAGALVALKLVVEYSATLPEAEAELQVGNVIREVKARCQQFVNENRAGTRTGTGAGT